MFKFLHAADLHLDSRLSRLEHYEGAPVDRIRNAGRQALENLVKLAVAENVAFVLVAGDLYDADLDDYTPLVGDEAFHPTKAAFGKPLLDRIIPLLTHLQGSQEEAP
jgi:hypothetical protein